MTANTQTFLYPRRFAEVWQMSEDWPGTLSQQDSVRRALAFPHGSDGHKLLKRLDRHVNDAGRSYLPIGFMDTEPRLAIAGAAGINLSENLKDPAIIAYWVHHEIFHVIDERDMITWDFRYWFMDQISGHHKGSWSHEYKETFADAGRDWLTGQRWFLLGPRLLSDQ